MEVSYKGGLEVQQRYEGGDLIRTWHRLVCHALVEAIVLDFRGTEVQRCRDEWEAQRGTSSERMGDFVNIQTKVQRWSTEDLYTMMIRSGIRCKYEEAYGKV